MHAPKSLRIKYWSYVFGWVGLIYSTLYVVRPLCTYLKETTPFSLLINVFVIGVLILVAFGIRTKIRITKPSSYFILSIVVLSYIYGLITIKYPEEKIHFIQYGFLAYLIFKAIAVDIQKPIAYVYALFLISIFGWIDEGIQYLLPNRYYQTEDVVLNCVSGALGLLLVFVYKRERAI